MADLEAMNRRVKQDMNTTYAEIDPKGLREADGNEEGAAS